MSQYRWLTELSQQFLDKDYLVDGQTTDERVTQACYKAEVILNKPGFAEKFKSYFQKGWYSWSTPIWTNFGNDRGLPISCVVGETWINTNVNGGKQASEICVGDEVLTHKGRYRKITNVMVTPERDDIYCLKVSGRTTDLYVTGNHLVLTNLGWIRTDDLDLELHLVATNCVVENLEVSHSINTAESVGLIYESIQKLEKTSRIATVYDFTVEEDHSFSAAGVVLHNCFGSHIEDNCESIASTWAEVFMMTKHGGGTSGYFGNLRGRGAPVKKNGESSGAVHFMQAFDNLINVVSQGKCYIEGTEVLTDSGFKDFRDVKPQDRIAQLDEFNNISFTDQYEMVVEDFDGDLVCFGGKKTDFISAKVTPNHRMVVSHRKMKEGKHFWPAETEIVLAKDIKLHRDNRLVASGLAGEGPGLSVYDRLRIAFQADGIKDGENRRIRFNFKKIRKIDRLTQLLQEAGIVYATYCDKDDTVDISFDYISDIKKNTFAEWVSLDKISGTWAQEFIDELSHWDDHTIHDSIVYSSIHKTNIDMVQAIASMCERKTRTWDREPEGNKQRLHSVCISEGCYRGGESIKVTHEYYKGKVYCAVVPQGRLMVRYQNSVLVCGNTRRGNFAAYLPIDHPDIWEFLHIRTDGFPIQDLFFGVCVPDYWMKEMIGDGSLAGGDRRKRVIWAKVLESRANIGFPYIVFIDTVNRNSPDCYQGIPITHSNLCVTGDQLALTSLGIRRVVDLYNSQEPLTLFDGTQTVSASPMRLVEKDVPVFEIVTKDGRTHKVTGYHKIKTELGMVAANELSLGERIYVQRNKGLFGTGHAPEEAFQLGLKHNLIGTDNKSIPDFIWSADEHTQERYIAGVFLENVIVSDDLSWLQSLQILLSNMGSNSIIRLHTSGFKNYKLINNVVYEAEDFDVIKEIREVGREDVYCTTVDSDEHVWVCNGFITSNCSEILLPNGLDESFVCDLSSMNDLYFDEWKDTDAVEMLVYFLDAVMTEFIEKAKKIQFMERTVKFAERHRALGIGQIGWHSYLQSKMIPFESMEAKRLNVKIAKTIKNQAYAASVKLAGEYGVPDACKGFGRRNTTLIAIAPTKSCTTPDTKFKDDHLNDIDYFEFTKRGGLDLNEIMSIEIELEDGKTIKFRYDEKIKVKRDGEDIVVMACNIAENDIY